MSLIDPTDTIERQNAKLMRIAESLMRRVEQKDEDAGFAYRQFERAALLESQVRERTRDLERTLDLLQESNAQLAAAHAERESARSNLREAIEAISEGFGLFDTNDELVLFNSRFCQYLRDVVPELTPGLAFTEYVKLVSRSAFLSLPPSQSAEEWSATRIGRHLDEHVVFNTRLKRNRWLQVSEHRMSNGGTVILQTDVSDIIQLERQERAKLRDEQAQMLQATLDHLNQAVCIFNRSGSLVGWNEKMNVLLSSPGTRVRLDLKFSQLLTNLRNHLMFPDNFSADQLGLWAEKEENRDALALELTRGDQVYSLFAQEMPDKGFVISFTDVTAERATARALFEMNEQLEKRVNERTHELGLALAEAERANASKSRFVAAASHDLLQPLSAAKLFVSSLAQSVNGSSEQTVVEKTAQALQGAEQIIEALLDISKLDLGKAAFNMQHVKMKDILDPLRNEMSAAAASKGLNLQVLDCSLTVWSDPTYLRRILQNLLSNAIRYTDSGRVLLGVRRNGDDARIEVWDSGRGIAKEDQQRVFNEFQRLDPDTSEMGLGLGLAIVERACKGLEHDLGLWSEKGLGSCFSVNVSLRTDVPKAKSSQGKEIDKSTCDLGGLLLLLVENDHDFGTALSMTVQQMGAKIIHAESAEEALTILHEIQLVPDVFLLDYQLGSGLNGLELYEHITQAYGQVSAAVISADRTLELRKSCKAKGITLMSKPLDRGKLRMFLANRSREIATPQTPRVRLQK